MTTAAKLAPRTASPGRTTALVLVVAALVAVAANSIVSAAALAAGADPSFLPLSLPLYGVFTVLGLAAAYAGWRLIRARVAHPARVLSVLVPVLAVLSFVPDTMLAIFAFIPGTTVTGVVGLALMHLVVLAVAIPVCLRLAPVR